MIVYFVRHGETAYNRDGLGLGRRDVPLNETGLRQVGAVGERLALEPIERIYTSPLARCHATAQAVAGERAIPIEPRDELIELDVGETEGMTFAAMRDQYPDFLRQWGGPEGHLARMPGGESLRDVQARVAPFLAQLQLDRPHGAIAIVSHNFVIRLAVATLLGLDAPAFRTISAEVASISTLQFRADRSVVVRSLNDRCHLTHLEP